MAILSKIRERSMFLILVIGLALFAFVLDPSTIADFFNASKVNEIGEVNGETISREEFALALDNYKTQTGNKVSEMQAAKTVWNNLVRQKIYAAQLEEAGITVGEEDIMNALYESPSVKNDARFQTQGIFDKDKLKEHLSIIKEDTPKEWEAWQNYMASLRDNLQKTAYDNLVGAGLGASLKEGETQYFNDNTKATAKFVYVPYTSIVDSLVPVTKGEIENYIKNHDTDFEVEASRDIEFIKFDVAATDEDEIAIKDNVAKLLEDKEEYSSVTKGNITIKGLKNTTDYATFLDENESDISLDDTFKFKSDISSNIAEKIFAGTKGDVFGPYKDQGYFKLSKITAVTKIPDSVKASHILIPFVGSRSADETTTQTEAQAKVTADSLLNVVKRSPSKFADLAKELSADKSNADKGGDLNWFTYNRMVPEFRNFCFENKKGAKGVVKTQFGFHIIKIDDQKNLQNAMKIVTFGRKIEPSEKTENEVFQNAETVALELSNGKSFSEIVKEKQLQSQPAVGLKVLDENVPGLGDQRQIITWAFEKDIKEGDFKRFDIDNGHVVAVVTGITEKGLLSSDKATTTVRPILVNEKKAKMIEEKMKGNTLAEIAKTTSQIEREASLVSLQSPTISGVGYEPKVVGAMVSAKENEVYKNVVGDRGVYAFVVTKKELPTTLPNYETFRQRIADQRKNKTYQMYEAIKNASNIEDNRAAFYGIQ